MCQDCIIINEPNACKCKCKKWETAQDNDHNTWEYCPLCKHPRISGHFGHLPITSERGH